MLSVIKGIKPRDQLEVLLASQMAVVHAAVMHISRALADAEYIEERESADRTFNKLARTFAMQLDTLKRYRSGGEQTVNVQHVTVSEGGQAIVNNVTQGQNDSPPSGKAAASLAITDAKTVPMDIIENKTPNQVAVPRSKK